MRKLYVLILVVILMFLFAGCIVGDKNNRYADIEMPDGSLITVKVDRYSNPSKTQTKILDVDGNIYIIDNSKVMIYEKNGER